MKHFILAWVMVSCVILFGCNRSGKNQNNLFNQAETIRLNAAQVQDEARKVMVSTERIASQVQINDNAIRGVLDQGGTITAPEVVERLGLALGANASILKERNGIVQSAHKVDTLAGDMTQAANSVTKSANRVEDVPSFWDRLTTSVRRLILIALGLVVIIIGWRFGLDKIVKSCLTIVSNGINTISDWAYSKYEGPAKLIREGKTEEAIAALRSAIPGLDKTFKRGDGTDA